MFRVVGRERDQTSLKVQKSSFQSLSSQDVLICKIPVKNCILPFGSLKLVTGIGKCHKLGFFPRELAVYPSRSEVGGHPWDCALTSDPLCEKEVNQFPVLP
jgi:hypothetical protein